MQNVYSLIDEVHALTDNFIYQCDVVTPAQLGLDVRCASYLYITKDMIACKISDHGNLQYYGGFDQIDTDDTVALGEYVFYLRTDENRIDGILESYYEVNA